MKRVCTVLLILAISPMSILASDIGEAYDQLFDLQHVRAKKVQKFVQLSREKAIEIGTYITEHGTKDGYFAELDDKTTSDAIFDGEILVSDALQQAESELSAALNPADTSQWVVSPINQSLAGTQGHITPIYYTSDFGNTWSTSAFRPDPSGVSSFMLGGGDPVFTFNKNGRCVFTWLSLELNAINQEYAINLYYAFSDDGGVTWTRPTNDIVDEGNVTTTFVDKQWMATDVSDSEYSGNVYCVYTVLSADLQITMKKLENGASEWSDRISLYGPQYDFRFLQFSSIDTDLDGNVHITFVGMEAGASTGALYYTVSTDGGDTFEDLTKISEFHTPNLFQNNNSYSVAGIANDRLYPCPHIAVDKSGGPYSGTAYAAWTANGINEIGAKGMDVFYSYMRPGGTWSAPQQVHDVDDASNQFYSSVAVSGLGDVVIAWYDQRNGPQNTHYRMAVSRNGGESFGASFELSTTPMNFPSIGNLNGGFGIGEYNQIMTTDYYAIPVWADGRKNNGDIDLYAATVNLETSSVDNYQLVDDRLALTLISPNPVTSKKLNVELYSAANMKSKLVLVHSTEGTSFDLGEFHLVPGSNTINVEVPDTATGSYRLVVQTAIGSVSDQVVITTH